MSEADSSRVKELSSLMQINREERMRLLQFVCSFAWADFKIHEEERIFVADLVRRLKLGAEDERQVLRWLKTPPNLDAIDPTQIPARHREIFLREVESVIAADGEVSAEERDSLSVFRQLLV